MLTPAAVSCKPSAILKLEKEELLVSQLTCSEETRCLSDQSSLQINEGILTRGIAMLDCAAR